MAGSLNFKRLEEEYAKAEKLFGDLDYIEVNRIWEQTRNDTPDKLRTTWLSQSGTWSYWHTIDFYHSVLLREAEIMSERFE